MTKPTRSGATARVPHATLPLCLPNPQAQDSVMRPRKAFYRARAHSNPFNDGVHLDIPPNPDAYDW